MHDPVKAREHVKPSTIGAWLPRRPKKSTLQSCGRVKRGLMEYIQWHVEMVSVSQRDRKETESY